MTAFAWRAAGGLAVLSGFLLAPAAAQASACVPASQWLQWTDAERLEAPLAEENAQSDTARDTRRGSAPSPGTQWCISPDDPRCAPGHQKGDGTRPPPDRSQGHPAHAHTTLGSPCRRTYDIRAAADAARRGVRFRVERPPRR